MKKQMKRWVAGVLTVAVLCGMSAINASALTRRLYGDVNNDGIISNADVTLVQQYVADMVEFDTYQKIAADVNGDGKISMLDVVMIQQVLAGQLDGFPVGDYFVY